MSAQEAAPDYNAAQAIQQIDRLRGTLLASDENRELERICDQAVTHQDLDVLLRLTLFEGASIQEYAIEKIKLLTVPLQKQAVAAVLRNDLFWNYDAGKQKYIMPHGKGHLDEQLIVRGMVGKLLGRDLRKESKYYNADSIKQAQAEAVYAPAILDPATREQLAKELLATP